MGPNWHSYDSEKINIILIDKHFNGQVFLFLHIYRPQRSCGKVMFLQASVILFTGEGVWQNTPHPLGRPPRQIPSPWADTPPPRRLLQRTVRIPLEYLHSCGYSVLKVRTCIPFYYHLQTRSGEMACM